MLLVYLLCWSSVIPQRFLISHVYTRCRRPKVNHFYPLIAVNQTCNVFWGLAYGGWRSFPYVPRSGQSYRPLSQWGRRHVLSLRGDCILIHPSTTLAPFRQLAYQRLLPLSMLSLVQILSWLCKRFLGERWLWQRHWIQSLLTRNGRLPLRTWKNFARLWPSWTYRTWDRSVIWPLSLGRPAPFHGWKLRCCLLQIQFSTAPNFFGHWSCSRWKQTFTSVRRWTCRYRKNISHQCLL